MKHERGSINYISLLIMLASFGVSILAAELVMRWYILGPAAFSYEMTKSVRHVGRSGVIQASAHQDILWELRPNLDTLFKLKEFRTNSEGQRDKKYPLEKTDGVFRIAVLGDSYTMGEGVAIENVWHTVLEDRLNAENNSKKFEFINFGVAGYSLPQYRATILHKVNAYKPDLIMIGFCGANDSSKPDLERFNQPYKVQPTGNGFLNGYFFEHIGNVYKRHYKIWKNRYPGYNTDESYMKGEFQKLETLVAETKTPVVIAYLSNRSVSADMDIVRKLSAKHGFVFINGTNGFGPEINPAHPIYLVDNHPNGVANRLMAESLYHELQAKDHESLKVFSDKDQSL